MKDFKDFFSNMQMKEIDEITPCSIDMNCDASFPHEKYVFIVRVLTNCLTIHVSIKMAPHPGKRKRQKWQVCKYM